jgi:hypothetical protein
MSGILSLARENLMESVILIKYGAYYGNVNETELISDY